MHEKNLSLTLLFDFYSEMLTEVQQNVFDLYYNEDMSLSEIAEQTGITRQGVRDSLKHAEELLEKYEERLGLSRRFEDVRHGIEEVKEKLSALSGHTDECGAELIKEAVLNLEKIERLS